MRWMSIMRTVLGFVPAMAISAAAHAEDPATKAPGPAAPPTPGVDLKAPLPSDERLVTGTLPNGLSYIVLKHSNPPGRAAMYIHIASGSFNEKDNQRGLAHFLEHMAFNGSENFPPGSVVDFFQSMGLRFGQDQNAFTSFEQTTYQLSFPDTKPETIERGMRFFSDIAFRLSLTQEGIDAERQVIFEEKRTREGGAQRMQDYVLERLIPGSLLGVRLPIGIADTLHSINRADFLDYYSHWYVPSNMTVIVVADADPKDMVAQISKSFAGGEKTPKPTDQDIGVKPFTSTRGIVATDKEQTQAQLQILSVSTKIPPVTTVGGVRNDLVREIGVSAFNRRIGAKLSKGGTSYLSAGASASNLFNAAFAKTIGIDGKPENWKPMLTEVGTELQRARLHGFTAREVDDVKKELIASAERYVEQELTVPGQFVIRQINGALVSGDTIMGAKNELALYKQLLPTISPSEVSEEFARDFDTTNVTFVAQLPTNVPGGVPTEQELVAAGRAALDVKPAAETESERPSELLAAKPAPGHLTDVVTHEPTKVVSAWLDNGIRVHYRFMDIRKDSVNVQVSLAGGSIQETAADRGVSDVAALAWSEPATSTLSSTNIRDLMTGKKVHVGRGRGGRGGFGGSPDAFSFSIDGSPEDLDTGFQLAYLLLTDPVIEPAAFDRWKTQQLQFIEMRKNSIDAASVGAVAQTIYPASDPRTQPLTAEQVGKLTVAAGQAWLKHEISTAPIEVTVVGDIAQDKAMQLVSAYLGALPKRDRIADNTLASLRRLPKAKGPIVNKLDVPTETAKAIVVNGFYTADASNLPDTRALNAASRIISTRMFKKVREEENLAYSPRANNQPGETYPGFGIFAMFSPTDPDKTDRLLKLSTDMFQEFATGGPTEEELTTVRKQFANDIDEQMKDPGFWVGRTSTMTFRNINLDDVVGASDYYQKMTAEQIKAAFNKYYTPTSVLQVVVKPAAGGGAGAHAGEKSSMNTNQP